MFFYIDPGTGSMLFTILIGLFGTLIYSIKIFKVKIKTMFGGKKNEDLNKKVPFAIYSDDKRYWSIFKPIVSRLDEYGKEILYLTSSEDDPVLKEEFKNVKAECIGKNNMTWFRLNHLNATLMFSTTPSLNVFQWKRSKKVDYYVHIPHAASDICMYRMFGIDYYDAIMLSGDYQADDVRALEKLRNLPEKELVKVGIPYMDEMAKRVKEAGKVKKHPRTVLLAPSWGKSAIFGVYGEKIIEELIKTGYHVIIRPHPQSFTSEKEMIEGLMAKYPNSDTLEWNSDTDNFEVLRRSDILISDFSGVIFDFTLIHEKPIIYTNPNFDLGPYDAWWLNKKIWTVSALERMGKELNEESFNDLKGLIDECLESTAVKENLKEIKEETWAYVGEGAERATKYLIEKYEQIEREKEEKAKAEKENAKPSKFNPLNWFRKKKTQPENTEDKEENVDQVEKVEEVSAQPDEKVEQTADADLQQSKEEKEKAV